MNSLSVIAALKRDSTDSDEESKPNLAKLSKNMTLKSLVKGVKDTLSKSIIKKEPEKPTRTQVRLQQLNDDCEQLLNTGKEVAVFYGQFLTKWQKITIDRALLCDGVDIFGKENVRMPRLQVVQQPSPCVCGVPR